MFYKNRKIHLLNDKQNYVKRLNLNDKLKNNLKKKSNHVIVKLKNLFNKFDFSIIIIKKIIFNHDYLAFQSTRFGSGRSRRSSNSSWKGQIAFFKSKLMLNFFIIVYRTRKNTRFMYKKNKYSTRKTSWFSQKMW